MKWLSDSLVTILALVIILINTQYENSRIKFFVEKSCGYIGS